MAKKLSYYVILNDGETYSGLEGCTIVGIAARNRAALSALDEEEMEVVFERADFVAAIEAPMPGQGLATSNIVGA